MLVLALFNLLLCLPLLRVSAEIQWEENFENPPFDDWTLQGYELINGRFYYHDNSPNIENGRLNMPGTDHPFGLGAYHNSTNAYGTWSFDWIIPDEVLQFAQVAIFFAGNLPVYLNGSDIDPPTLNTYLVYIETVHNSLEDNCFNVTFGEYNYGVWRFVEEYAFPEPITGVVHFDITRDPADGTIRIYTNASPKPIITVVNNRIKTSERLCFWTWEGVSSIDNVVVYDTVEKTEPKSNPAFTIEVILLPLFLGILYSRKRRH